MKKNDVAVLDFGSGKIVCLVGAKTADGFIVKASGQSAYSGFAEANWLEPEKLIDAVSFAIGQAEEAYGHSISSLFVGVPGEFTNVMTSESSLRFKSRKRINRDDLNEIYQRANIYKDARNLIPISRSVICYNLDDANSTVEPLNCLAEKINGQISYIFINENFSKVVSSVLDRLEITQYEYVSSCLAEALYLLPSEERDKQAILIDVGYITSSVMLVGGDGLMFMRSFSVGSGHICADLCQVLEISYTVAKQLYQKINLNLQFLPTDTYALNSGAEIKAAEANEIVKARIEDIADYVIRCFDSYQSEINLSTPIYITGGGLTYTKGAIEHLSRALNKRITPASTLDPLKNKPEFSSAYGLLHIAAEQKANKRF